MTKDYQAYKMVNKLDLLQLTFQGDIIPRKTINLIKQIHHVHLILAEDLITLLVQPMKSYSKKNAQNLNGHIPLFNYTKSEVIQQPNETTTKFSHMLYISMTCVLKMSKDVQQLNSLSFQKPSHICIIIKSSNFVKLKGDSAIHAFKMCF